MANEAERTTFNQAPHGSEEGVPVRSGGVQIESPKTTGPQAIATYGTEPTFKIPEHINSNIADISLHKNESINNPTKQERIEKDDGFYNHSFAA